jgi:hypothetical protein
MQDVGKRLSGVYRVCGCQRYQIEIPQRTNSKKKTLKKEKRKEKKKRDKK